MKIHDSVHTPTTTGASMRAIAGDKSATASPSRDLASTLAAGARLTDSIPFDHVKVEQLKLAIANGTYHVDATKIAEGLITSARELIQSKRTS